MLGGVITSTEQLWEHIPGLERSEQYAAFEFYRDSDPKVRSLADTARATGVTYGTIHKWARDCYWVDRVASYDQHRNAQRAAERVKAEQIADRTWAEKRAEILQRMDRIIENGLIQLALDQEQRRGRIRPNELARIAEIRLRFGNLSNGDATEQVANVIDLRNADDETLAALERLRDFEKGVRNEDGTEDTE